MNSYQECNTFTERKNFLNACKSQRDMFFTILVPIVFLLLTYLCTSCNGDESYHPVMWEGANMHEYQMDVSEQGYTIYEGMRCVGYVPRGQTQGLDSLIDADNQ